MAEISKTRWTSLVREGRQAVKEEGDAKWRLGDLALQIVPLGENGAHNGSTDLLQEYADEIGVEAETLRAYRHVAATWPPDRRLSGASWSVHQITTPDDLDLLKRLKAEHPKGRITVDAVRQAKGRKPTRYPPPSSTPPSREVQVAQTRAALADPEIAREALKDTETLRQVESAVGDTHRRRVAERQPAIDRAAARTEPIRDVLADLRLIGFEPELDRLADTLHFATEQARPIPKDFLLRTRTRLTAMQEDVEVGLARHGDTDEELARMARGEK